MQIRNRIETRASENRLPAIGTPITNTAQTMISTRSKIDSTRYGIALAMMIIIGLIGEVSSTSIEPVSFSRTIATAVIIAQISIRIKPITPGTKL